MSYGAKKTSYLNLHGAPENTAQELLPSSSHQVDFIAKVVVVHESD